MLGKMKKRKGQATLEFSVLIIIIIGALIATSIYIKRGIQGRWKANVDTMGDQYDPRVAETDILQTLTTTTITQIEGTEVPGGVVTTRSDETATEEVRAGATSVTY